MLFIRGKVKLNSWLSSPGCPHFMLEKRSSPLLLCNLESNEDLSRSCLTNYLIQLKVRREAFSSKCALCCCLSACDPEPERDYIYIMLFWTMSAELSSFCKHSLRGKYIKQSMIHSSIAVWQEATIMSACLISLIKYVRGPPASWPRRRMPTERRFVNIIKREANIVFGGTKISL